VTPRAKARILGLFISLMGIGLVAANCYDFLNRGIYYPKTSVFGPFFTCPGLSLMLYPMTKEESVQRFREPANFWLV